MIASIDGILLVKQGCRRVLKKEGAARARKFLRGQRFEAPLNDS